MSRMRCGMRLLKQAWIILLMLWMLLDGFSFIESRGIDSAAYGRASSPAGEAFFQAVARALIVGGALRSTMGDPGERFRGEPGIAELSKQLQEKYKRAETLLDIIDNRPWELVRFLMEITQRELTLDRDALLSNLVTTGVSNTDIRNFISGAIAKEGDGTGSKGSQIFDTTAADLRSDQKIDWTDEFVAQRILGAYLDGEGGLTRDDLTVKAIRAADETRIAQITGIINGLVPDLGKDLVALLQESLARVRASWLPSLERQISQLTSALAQVTQQLGAAQQELQGLKSRKDPLPLALAVIALVLSASTLGIMALRRRQA